MKFIKLPLIFSALTLIILTNCTKDKKVESETTAVTTSKNGKVYEVNTVTSKIEWKGYKIVKSENAGHIGNISMKSGEVTVNNGKLESGKFVADMTTLTSEDLKNDPENLAKLNGHLKSADFFDVEKYPTTTYEITKVSEAPAGSDYNTILDGNLTIKGITKPVQFNANVSMEGETIKIATQPKDISREQFGIVFQMPAANGLIKDEMTLQIVANASAKK
ncbi:YceI family protein [Halpernia frigidisoli]|uniref:Polyisoprenoid-binding protein YceI n=1 Tax=Halpernia frigidisoli TaxID=1125876 RepID=A0A1I3ECJ8_9FLAO|nr:YceI family protein [Halpernia frigidisoli]SFH96707.1 Polyisoprenoid-binding protein YceI [Halpernia frigidisoli]